MGSYLQHYVRNASCEAAVLGCPPGGYASAAGPRRVIWPAMIMRSIEPIAGLPRIRIRIRPLFDYGAVKPRRTIGSNHLRFAGPEHALGEGLGRRPVRLLELFLGAGEERVVDGGREVIRAIGVQPRSR